MIENNTPDSQAASHPDTEAQPKSDSQAAEHFASEALPPSIAQAAGHIELEMLPNTRDLSYLTFSSGQTIAPRRLLRSGTLGEASAADLATLLEDYAVKTVIDLRTQEEKEKNPDPKDKMPGVRFVDAPIFGFSATGVTRENGLVGMVKTIATLRHDPRKLMCGLYAEMLLDEQGIQGYTQFFQTLLSADEGAILWHCSAGKDRVGLASALLLTALGATREQVESDYLATNQYLANRADDLKKLIPTKLLSKDVLESLQILNSADIAFLNAGIEAVDKEFGSLDRYLTEALGVDEEVRETLKNKFFLPS